MKFVNVCFKLVMVVVGVVLVLVMSVAINFRPSPSDTTGATAQNKATTAAPLLTPDLALVDFEWGKVALGGLLTADFWLQNNTGDAIKDMVIQCDGFTSGGTKIDSNIRTIHQTVKPHTTKSVTGVSMGLLSSRVSEEGCALKSWRRVIEQEP
jgi:hypothetical protein